MRVGEEAVGAVGGEADEDVLAAREAAARGRVEMRLDARDSRARLGSVRLGVGVDGDERAAVRVERRGHEHAVGEERERDAPGRLRRGPACETKYSGYVQRGH